MKDHNPTQTATTTPQEVANVWNWGNEDPITDETIVNAKPTRNEDFAEALHDFIVEKMTVNGYPPQPRRIAHLAKWIERGMYDWDGDDGITAGEIATQWIDTWSKEGYAFWQKGDLLDKLRVILVEVPSADVRRVIAFAQEVADARKR